MTTKSLEYIYQILSDYAVYYDTDEEWESPEVEKQHKKIMAELKAIIDLSKKMEK